MSSQQLFGWRREARALFCEEAGGGASAAGGSEPSSPAAPAAASEALGISPAFAPVVLVAPAAAPPGSGGPPSDAASKPGVIEIVVGGMVVRVLGPVDADALATVLMAARRASR